MASGRWRERRLRDGSQTHRGVGAHDAEHLSGERSLVGQSGESELATWEAISRLEAVAAEHPHGSISIERHWKISELPWSCNIYCGEYGYGTGSTLVEAVEDALRDLDGHT